MEKEDIRFIQNPFKKIYNIIHPDQDKLYNILFAIIQDFLSGSKLPTLNAVASDPSQTQKDISAYAGVNGYIYTLIRLSIFMKSDMINKNSAEEKISQIIEGDEKFGKLKNPQFYLKLAMQQYVLVKDYLQSKKKKKLHTLSFYMSQTCTWLCGMHLGYLTNDPKLFRLNEEKLIHCFNLYNHNKQAMMWEILYGVPGFLYCFLQLQRDYDKHENSNFKTNFSLISVALTQDILAAGISAYEKKKGVKIDIGKELPQDFRLVYQFHNKQYLGGAHGIGGNLNLLLLSMKMNRVENFINFLPALTKSVHFLMRHFINGNFSTSAGSQRIKLIHFCHGNPGIVSGLARFYLMFPEEGIKLGIPDVLKKALSHIWDYGVLKKGFGLCHGISGNAYAFIAPSIQELFIDEKEELKRKAMLFGLLLEEKDVMKEIRGYHFSDRFRVGISDNPYSLMLGSAGDICFIIDLFQGKAQFPGFDF